VAPGTDLAGRGLRLASLDQLLGRLDQEFVQRHISVKRDLAITPIRDSVIAITLIAPASWQ
jgi:hypothetical protein